MCNHHSIINKGLQIQKLPSQQMLFCVAFKPLKVLTHQIAHTLWDYIPACQACVQHVWEVEHEKILEHRRVAIWLCVVECLCWRWSWEDKVHEVLDNTVVERMKEWDNPDPVPVKVTKVLRNQADAQGTLRAKLNVPLPEEEQAKATELPHCCECDQPMLLWLKQFAELSSNWMHHVRNDRGRVEDSEPRINFHWADKFFYYNSSTNIVGPTTWPDFTHMYFDVTAWWLALDNIRVI